MTICSSHNINFFREIARFCKQNGFHYISVVGSNSTASIKSSRLSLLKSLQNESLFTRSFEMESPALSDNLEYWTDSLILHLDLKSINDIDNILSLATLLQVKKTMIVFEDPPPVNDRLKSSLDKFQKNALIYLAYPSVIKQIITLTNTPNAIVTDVILNSVGIVVDSYDLQGLELTCASLPWAPMFIMKDCDMTSGFGCSQSGMLSDHMDAMCDNLNCTWDCRIDVDGNWGVAPASGPFNKSGVWNGVMGSIINDEAMMSVGTWAMTGNRFGLMDFVIIGTNRPYLAYTPGQKKSDWTLFLRPFNKDAWTTIALITVLAFLANIVPYAFLGYYEDTEGYKINTLTTWLFFVGINAYYGGALTMFFAIEDGISFNTMDDVLRVYPDWNFILTLTNEVYFQQKVNDGDPLYVQLWDRVVQDPENTVYTRIEEGLAKIKADGQTAMHVEDVIILGFFKANPFFQQEVKLFAPSQPNYYSIIVNRGSPLKPILQSVSTKIAEGGAIERLANVWIGSKLPTVIGGEEKTVLNIGDTITIFLLILAVASISVGVLVYEIYDHRRKTRYHTRKNIGQSFIN